MNAHRHGFDMGIAIGVERRRHVVRARADVGNNFVKSLSYVPLLDIIGLSILKPVSSFALF